MSSDPIAMIAIAVAVVVVGFLAVTIWRAAAKGETKTASDGLETHVRKQCLSCGWEGMVSKYHKKCSKCGDKLI
jgi:hypothetical protein